MNETSAVDSEAKSQCSWLKITLVGLAVSATVALTSFAVSGTVLPSHRDQPSIAHPDYSTPITQAPLAETQAAQNAAANVVSYSVTYQLIGSGSGNGTGTVPGTALDIIYVTQGADIEQEAQVHLPWSKTVARLAGEKGTGYLTMSARNSADATLLCRIRVNGSVVVEHSVSGIGSVVRCASS